MAKETEMVVVQKKPTTSANRLQDVEAQDDNDDDTEEKKWREMERSVVTRVVQGTAGASIILNIVAMAIYQGATIGMGLVAMLVGSVVIFFQFMIQDTDCKWLVNVM